MMQEWDYGKHQYKQYSVPKEWNCTTFAGMEDKINCAKCGKTITFGEAFSSMEIHDDYGMGFAVCEACYEHETERAMEDNTWSE